MHLWANTWLRQGENDGGSGVLLNTTGFFSITLRLGIVFDAIINAWGLFASVHDCTSVHVYVRPSPAGITRCNDQDILFPLCRFLAGTWRMCWTSTCSNSESMWVKEREREKNRGKERQCVGRKRQTLCVCKRERGKWERNKREPEMRQQG